MFFWVTLVAHEKLISNKMQFMNIKDQVDHKAGRECVHKIDREGVGWEECPATMDVLS